MYPLIYSPSIRLLEWSKSICSHCWCHCLSVGCSRIGLQKTEDFISFVNQEKVSVLFYRLLHLLDTRFSDLCQNQMVHPPDLAIWQGNTDNKNIGKYRVEGHALGTLKNREWPSYLSVVMECHGQRRNSSHEEFHLLKD